MTTRGAASLALLLWCSSCSPLQLQGSLSTVIDLTYKTSQLKIANGSAALLFVRPDQAANNVADAGAFGEDLVFKVVTQLTPPCGPGQLEPGEVFDLSKSLPGGTQCGTLSRAVVNDPITAFPPILGSSTPAPDGGPSDGGQPPPPDGYGPCLGLPACFVIYGTPVLNKYVSGYFSVTFIDSVDGGLEDEASGRAVYANFSTYVCEVDGGTSSETNCQ